MLLKKPFLYLWSFVFFSFRIIIIIMTIIIIMNLNKFKFNGRNKVSAINAWGVPIFRYGARIIQWKTSEIKDLDRKSRKT